MGVNWLSTGTGVKQDILHKRQLNATTVFSSSRQLLFYSNSLIVHGPQHSNKNSNKSDVKVSSSSIITNDATFANSLPSIKQHSYLSVHQNAQPSSFNCELSEVARFSTLDYFFFML